MELAYRKVPHESPEEYIRQNNALVALHGWRRKTNAVSRRTHRISFIVRSNVSGYRTEQVRNVVGLYSDVSATVECPGGHHSAETRALSVATDYLEHILRGIERREYDHRRENLGHLRQSVDPRRERRRPTNRYSLSVSLSLSLFVSPSASSWVDPCLARAISIGGFCLTLIISKSKRKSFTRRKIPSFKWETSRRNCRRESSFVSTMLIFS